MALLGANLRFKLSRCCGRALERNTYELTARSRPHLLKELLQGCLYRAVGDAQLAPDLFTGEAFKDALQNLLLAFRQACANFFIRSIVNPVCHESNHAGIHPHFSAHNQPDGDSERAWRIALEKDAR